MVSSNTQALPFIQVGDLLDGVGQGTGFRFTDRDRVHGGGHDGSLTLAPASAAQLCGEADQFDREAGYC
jgi:hypothetical protein